MHKVVNGVKVLLSKEEIILHDKRKALKDAEILKEEKNRYKRKRLKEYPSVGEQLDLIYHGGLDAWRAEIKRIKDKYPKPVQ